VQNGELVLKMDVKIKGAGLKIGQKACFFV